MLMCCLRLHLLMVFQRLIEFSLEKEEHKERRKLEVARRMLLKLKNLNERECVIE